MKKCLLWMMLLSMTLLLLCACGEDDTTDNNRDNGDYTPQEDGDIDTDGALSDGDEGESATEGEEPVVADGDEDTTSDEPIGDCALPSSEPYCPPSCYVEENPGIGFDIMVSSMDMMGQKVGLGVGVITTATRESFHDTAEMGEGLMPDTCRIDTPPANAQPECASDADCAPEQSCLPETNDDGSPIENSERCVTEVEPLDIGAYTLSGFASGTKTFRYNAGQQGAYTENGAGDGQIDPSAIGYDTEYTLTGEGSAEHNLGAFTGSLTAPPAFEFLSPEPVVDPQMGMPFIQVYPSEGLTFQWRGSDNPQNTLILNVSASDPFSGEGASFTCLLRDDGEFMITAEQFAEIGLDATKMSNFMIQQEVKGDICGEGVGFGKLIFQQMFTVFVQVME